MLEMLRAVTDVHEEKNEICDKLRLSLCIPSHLFLLSVEIYDLLTRAVVV